MNFRLRLLPALAALTVSLQAAVPPAPKLLPEDTLALFTVPDWGQTLSGMKASSAGAFWSDPALKPFRDHVEAKFGEQILGDLEKELGIKVADYLALLQGQFTVALVQAGWKGAEGTEPAWLVVIDTKDKAPELKKQLEEVRKKLTDAKKPLKAEKIRDVEFSVLNLELPNAAGDEDGADADPKEAKPAEPRKMTLYFGQADTALVVGTSAKALEPVVARLTGSQLVTIGENPAFQASEGAWFQKSYAYGWVHFTPVINALMSRVKGNENTDAMGVDPKAAVKALGLTGLKTASFATELNAEGSGGVFSLAVAEADRTGLFKMLAPNAKDAGPAAFIPADAVKFQRVRLDGQKVWATLEETLAAVSPQLAGFAQMMIGTAGKDKDPNFDFKRSFVGNLGDDLITYSKAATGTSQQELMNPPTLTLMGSPNPEALAMGMKAASGFLPSAGEELKDREFNGKKIRALRLPPEPGQRNRKLELSSSGGYVVMGSNPALLEEYLRSAEGSGKSLRDDPAIARAAEKVGGLNTGFFGYENQRETMRAQWEFLRSGGFDKVMDQSGAAGKWREVFDFKLLPAYDQIAKHFGIAVFAGSADPQGLNLKFYGPNPR